MTDDTGVAAEAAADDGLRADLEDAWDTLSAEPEDEDGDGEEFAPPDHWPAAWRERFEALPAEGRDYALDLHRQFEQAHSERSQALAEREKALDGMEAVDAALAPWRETLAAQGLTDADAVARLMEAQAALENDPGAALAALGEAYGLAAPAAARRGRRGAGTRSWTRSSATPPSSTSSA